MTILTILYQLVLLAAAITFGTAVLCGWGHGGGGR